jgi:phosphoglycolate phosphatase
VKLLLFDVDGTLVLTGGAGVRAMNRAFFEVFGVPEGFRQVRMAGGTDPRLLDEALANAGIADADGRVARFVSTYIDRLGEEIHKPLPPPSVAQPDAHGKRWRGPLPGIPALLDALSGRTDVFLALLTGNYSRGAEIKLAHFDLWRYFRCGAFGEDAERRPELVPVAIARARASGCPALPLHDVVIVGDTTRDVDCARDAGIRCVAVATGGDDASTLRHSGAEHVFDTLEDTDAVLQALLTP